MNNYDQQIKAVEQRLQALELQTRQARYGIGGVTSTCKNRWAIFIGGGDPTSGIITLSIAYEESGSANSTTIDIDYDATDSDIITAIETAIPAVSGTFSTSATGQLPNDAIEIVNNVTSGDRMTSIRYHSQTMGSSYWVRIQIRENN